MLCCWPAQLSGETLEVVCARAQLDWRTAAACRQTLQLTGSTGKCVKCAPLAKTDFESERARAVCLNWI